MSTDARGKTKKIIEPGPHLGTVKQTANSHKDGRIGVHISFKSYDENDPKSWAWVSYASPFYGTTVKKSKSTKTNSFEESRQSYGMWTNVPDIGTKVLVMFVNGDWNQGYWIACVPETSQHSMVPANGSTKNYDKETIDPDSKELQAHYCAQIMPTAEVNTKSAAQNQSTTPADTNKPVHPIQTKILAEQGLLADRDRGPIDSSSAREAPSGVFGISTPGRSIYDEVTDDRNVQCKPGQEAVDHSKKKAEVTGRKGGHSFVMDDGDTFGKNRMVRLRSAAGHQVLLNDTKGFIYIANSEGTNWIEMSADGQIRIFADDAISIRTKSDMNIRADNDINFDAGNNMNLRAGKLINLESDTQHFNASVNSLLSSKQVEIHADVVLKLDTNGGGYLSAGGNLDLKSGANGTGKIYLNTNPKPGLEDVPKQKLNPSPDVSLVGTNKWKVNTAIKTNSSKPLPSHEPFTRAGTPPATTGKPAKEIEGPTKPEPDLSCAWDEEYQYLSKEETQQAKADYHRYAKNQYTAEGWDVSEDEYVEKRKTEAKEAYQDDAREKTLASGKSTGSSTTSNKKAVAAPKVYNKSGKPFTYGAADNRRMSNKGHFMKQPDPTKNIKGLTAHESKVHYTQMGFMESSSVYNKKNDHDYMGKYQLGSAALEDSGYIKKGTHKATKGLGINYAATRPEYWTRGNSPTQFLNNSAQQEDAMEKYTASNLRTLRNGGVITDQSTRDEIVGYLGPAHLTGAGNEIEKFYGREHNKADGNETSGEVYKNNAIKAQNKFKSLG